MIKESIKKIISIFGYPIRYYRAKRREKIDREKVGVDLLDLHFSPPNSRPEIKKYLKTLRKLNISWARISFDWYSYQKRGKKYLEVFDPFIKRLVKKKIKILGVICNVVPGNFGNFFFGPAKDSYPAPVDYSGQFLDFTAHTVNYFKKRIKFWEFMNEPDLKRHWVHNPNPDSYTKMLKKAYLIIKSVDPKLSVISGGITGINLNNGIDTFDISFLQELVKKNFARHCDIIAIHPYTLGSYLGLSPDPIFYLREAVKKTNKMIRFIRKANLTQEIWVTEFGINPMWSFLNHRQIDQIYYLLVRKLINSKKLGKVFLFNFRDFPNKDYEFFNPDPYFGLVSKNYNFKESTRFLVKERWKEKILAF